uniref:Uncharacterized protein n=1 Tax=Daphnia galeata TaxID=27404 RepID=A0A8J2S399_9CRUS|nr:unnamed protein product [Daphnia galeata]
MTVGMAQARCRPWNWNNCSAGKMWDAYNEMRRVNCKFCDKYFHCMGNYNAVYSCSGSEEDKKCTAKKISDVREWRIFYLSWRSFDLTSGNSGADSAADQAANLVGRNNRSSCASTYLANVRCAYNPSTRECKW